MRMVLAEALVSYDSRIKTIFIRHYLRGWKSVVQLCDLTRRTDTARRAAGVLHRSTVQSATIATITIIITLIIVIATYTTTIITINLITTITLMPTTTPSIVISTVVNQTRLVVVLTTSHYFQTTIQGANITTSNKVTWAVEILTAVIPITTTIILAATTPTAILPLLRPVSLDLVNIRRTINTSCSITIHTWALAYLAPVSKRTTIHIR